MDLWTLITTITDTGAGEWESIWSPAYPSYYVLTGDVSVALAWGVHGEDDEWTADDSNREAWVPTCPDRRVFDTTVEVLYNGQVVYQVSAVVLDGGRFMMAVPENDVVVSDDSVHGVEMMGYALPKHKESLMRVVNDLLGAHALETYSRYFEKSGIRVS